MIPVEAVEAAAKAHHGVISGGGESEWGYLDKKAQDNRLYWMSAALEAAAPLLMAAAWDRAAASIIDEHGNPLVPTNVTNPYRD